MPAQKKPAFKPFFQLSTLADMKEKMDKIMSDKKKLEELLKTGG
jgi:hypothetical protein